MKGWPDYTKVTGLVDNYDEYGENYPIGIGDGAARLGSIKTYDMRGRAWWLEDFEAAVLHWQTRNIGVGGSQGLVTDYANTGNQALGLTANTGAGRISRAYRLFSLPRHAPIGIEIHFSQEADFGLFQLNVDLDDAATMTTSELWLNSATGILSYADEFNVHQNTGLMTGLTDDLQHFHTFKLVFDYTTDEYLRILYDDQELNLTGIPMRTIGTSGSRWLYINLIVEGDNVNNARMCFDDVIITTMEPE